MLQQFSSLTAVLCYHQHNVFIYIHSGCCSTLQEALFILKHILCRGPKKHRSAFIFLQHARTDRSINYTKMLLSNFSDGEFRHLLLGRPTVYTRQTLGASNQGPFCLERSNHGHSTILLIATTAAFKENHNARHSDCCFC